LKPLSKAESRRCYKQPNPEFDALEHHLAGLPPRRRMLSESLRYLQLAGARLAGATSSRHCVPPDRVANKPDVTVIICTSRKATRQPEPNEVILDANDGLDWPTLCKCDLLYTIQMANLVNRRGAVSAERRRQIIATINRVNGWV
jgi:hypothetical protein